MSLAVLLLVYAAGYSGGRDAASLGLDAKAHQNHPACHPQPQALAAPLGCAATPLGRLAAWSPRNLLCYTTPSAPPSTTYPLPLCPHPLHA